jgi:hypothetical protein
MNLRASLRSGLKRQQQRRPEQEEGGVGLGRPAGVALVYCEPHFTSSRSDIPAQVSDERQRHRYCD